MEKNLIVENQQESFDLKPDDPNDRFLDVQSTHDGKYVVIQTLKEYQVYDQHWEM